eukprot:346559-Rhodomonas_salina.2
MDDFVHCFLKGPALQRLVLNAVQNAIDYVTDPITDVVCSMINTPVCAMFTTTGLMPFVDKPNIALPYAHMTQEQRERVCELLQAGGGKDADAHAELHCNCVVLKFTRQQASTRLQAYDVLLAMCQLVLGECSAEDSVSQLAICNVLLQRVRSSVHLPHDTFVHLYAQMRSMYPALQETDIQKQGQLLAPQANAVPAGEAQGTSGGGAGAEALGF